MPRLKPPPGYMTATEAAQALGISDSLLSRYVKHNKLSRYGPEKRIHKWYKVSEVEALKEAERLFTPAYQPGDYKKRPVCSWSQATEDDMPAIVEISRAIFGDPVIPVETRLVWLHKAPESFYALRNQAGTIVGYSSILALKREIIDQFVRGEMQAEQITADDVIDFQPGQPLHLYVMAIGIDPQYSVKEKHEYGARLVAGLFSFLYQMAEQGIEISTITARSHKPDGLRLLRKMGFPQLHSPVPHISLFVVNVADSGFPVFERYKELLLLAKHRQTLPTMPYSSPAPARIAPPTNRRIQTDQDTSAPGWRERRKSSKPQLPDGWSSWNGFITRHGVRIDQQDIKALNRADYCEPGEYLDGRFTVAHALSPDGQARLWQTLASIPTLASKLHQCQVEQCPCHGGQS